ncbi:unnamed protein product [Fraxinus pennsylvanica]|uniref:ABC-2 type transporter transmembrane domain-containing protein n=1 Tax=Fraxinus pennsylvanica TaxID=56036 RepID=A0AAD1ZYD4_9LAMI|nr:unnamed protein product [Fraxinus pennsylvanica]
MNAAEFLIDLAKGNIKDKSIPSELEDKLLTGVTHFEDKDGRPSPGDVHEEGLLFFISDFLGFLSSIYSRPHIPTRKAMLAKERSVDMYKLSAYLVARNTSDLPLDLVLPIVLLVVVYFMANLKMTFTASLLTSLTVFLSIIAAQCNPVFPIEHSSNVTLNVSGFRTGHRSSIHGSEKSNESGFGYCYGIYVVGFFIQLYMMV